MRESSQVERERTGRSGTRLLLSLLVASLLSLTALTSSAFALSQRGFAFAGSFGTPGVGAGQLSSPRGVAVSQKNGDIYVVDAGNNRIDRFDSTGKFIEAWGFGVKNGEKELETCSAECRVGLAGHKPGQLHGAEAIAIDNDPQSPSYGDVYVEAVTPYEEPEEEFEYGEVTKYGENGSLIGNVKGHWEELWGLAVSPSGHLLVYFEEAIEEYNGEVSNKKLAEIPTELDGSAGGSPRQVQIAADAHNDVYLGNAYGSGPTSIAKVFIFEEKNEKEKVEKIGAPLIEALDEQNSTGVAVDPSDENVIVDNGTSLALFNIEGELVQRFGGEGEGALQGGVGVTTRPDAALRGSSEVLVADAASGRIELFAPAGSGAPSIDEIAAVDANASSVQLTATVDPDGATGETEYRYRYSTGTVPVAGEECSGSCVEVPVPAARLTGSAGHFGDLALPAQQITGLAASTTYHFRLIVSNEHATVESRELKFKTRTPEPLPDSRHWSKVSPAEKNGGYIDAMPLEGGDDQASVDGSKITYTSSAALKGSEGNRAPETDQLLSVRRLNTEGKPEWTTTNLQTPVEKAEGFSPNSGNEYRAFSPGLDLAFVSPFGKEQFEHPELTPEATERTIYLRHNESCTSPTACYTAMVTAANVTGETEKGGVKEKSKFGESLQLLGGDASAEQAILKSGVPLTSEKTTVSQNLYEWSNGELHLVNVLPSGETGFAELGYRNHNLRNAISADGSRVVWTSNQNLYVRFMGLQKTIEVNERAPGAGEAGEPGEAVFQAADANDDEVFFTDAMKLTVGSTASSGKPDLYVCQIENPTTDPTCLLRDLSVDANAHESANVQGAIPAVANDGSEAFFVADGSLAAGAPQGNCILNQDAGSRLQEEYPHARLASVCNLYVEHREGSSETGTWGAPQRIATLSAEDEPDWDRAGEGNLRYLSDRLSANGEWFAFMSDRSLTGYDNRDAASGWPDEEVYLFNAAKGTLVCASCDPSGARPHGFEDVEESGEGIGPLVDRRAVWINSWLAASLPTWPGVSAEVGVYQPNYLTDSGRLFFNTSQQLVPQDQNHTQDVYEYEPEGLTGPDGAADCTTTMSTFDEQAEGCVALISGGTPLEKESAFLDAGENGQDVFFDTAAQLTTGDGDQSFDVYDAEVCGIGGAPECVPEPPVPGSGCDSLASCRGGEANPTLETPGGGSLTPGAVGNSSRHEVLGTKTESAPKPAPKPLTRAQKYAKALKACKKLKNKHRREACDRLAKKRYGPIKKTAKTSSHGRTFR